jgi:hypothetical protein
MLLLALTLLASAADHELDAKAGATVVHRTDLVASPLPYTGVLPTITVGWAARGKNDVHRVAIAAALGSIQSGPAWDFRDRGDKHSAVPSPVTFADFRYAYGRRISGDGWRLNLGGTFHSDVEHMVYPYAVSGVSMYMGVFTVGPWADLRVDLADRHTLTLEAWTPVVAWVGRNPYGVHDAEYIWDNRAGTDMDAIVNYIGGGHLETVDRHQALHLRTSWSGQITDHFGFVGGIRADVLHLTHPRPTLEYRLGADLGVKGVF